MGTPLSAFKALSNEHRLNILRWLRDPITHFESLTNTPEQLESLKHNFGVCVGLIQRRCGLSQPTVSSYLSQLEKAGLVITKRYGKWTHYGRNEETIGELADFIQGEL